MVLTLTLSEKKISCLEEFERDHEVSDVRRMASELLELTMSTECCRRRELEEVSLVWELLLLMR